jgi:hypothetical protein
VDLIGKVLRALALMSIVVVLKACGLPTISYLYKPTVFTVDNATISVTHSILNYEVSEGIDQSYKGLEIFYHIYDTQEQAAEILTTLSNHASTYAENPDSFIKIATGTNLNFQRMRNTLTSSEPLIPIDNPQNDQSYYIDIKSNAYWIIKDSAGNSLTDGSLDISNIIRTIANRTPVGFHEKDFLVGDSDYTQKNSFSPDTVYIVCFTVSFGTDINTLGAVLYSDPLIGSNYITYKPEIE